MRNFTIYLAALFCLLASKMIGQESFEKRAKEIATRIEKITKEEKAALKEEIEAVNLQLQAGTITKEAIYQSKLPSGTQARVEPNRRWFENTRVVGQKELDAFRMEMKVAEKDPYSFVIRTKQLPLGLAQNMETVIALTIRN